MVSNKKTLRKIIDEIFLISEEKKQFNNEYINSEYFMSCIY